MLVPVYGFMQGDTLGLLVLAQDNDTMADVAQKIKVSASVRVDCASEYKLIYKGKEMPNGVTMNEAGITALDRVDLKRI